MRTVLWGIFLWLLWVLPAPAQTDFFERNLPLPASPQRIISLSPATTEMLFAIGAQKQLVGVTHDCNYPAAAQSREKVGRFGQIQLEKLVKLKPDLILVTSDMRQVLSPLKRFSVPVIAFESPSIRSIQVNLIALGQLTGRVDGARDAVQAMQAALKQQAQTIAAFSHTPRAFYLLWDQPLITAGQQSFIGDVLKHSGVQNVVAQTASPFPHYSLEKLLKVDPEVLIIPQSVAARIQLQRPPFNRLQAVKNQRILTINDDIISRPAPRVIQAMQTILDFLKTQKLAAVQSEILP